MLKKLKKDSIREKFDFNLIYPTTHDAVEHIVKPNMSEHKVSKQMKIKTSSLNEKGFFQDRNSIDDDYYSEMDLDESLMSVDENMDMFTSI